MEYGLDELMKDCGTGPAILLPSQMESPRQRTAEEKLVVAVMDDAIRTVIRYQDSKKKPKPYFDTIDWFASDETYPFSFLSICEALSASGTEFSPSAIRERLAKRLVVAPVRRQHITRTRPVAKRVA